MSEDVLNDDWNVVLCYRCEDNWEWKLPGTWSSTERGPERPVMGL